MKNLLGIAVTGFALFVVAQTPTNKATTKEHPAESVQQSTTDTQKGVVAIGGQTIVTPKTEADDIEIQRQLSKFTKYLVWVGGIQALILGGTLLLIWRQASLMKTHAEHLENLAIAAGKNATAAVDNAIAAKTSADALINSERAWVIATINKIAKNVPMIRHGQNSGNLESLTFFYLVLKNLGRTPAQVFAVLGGTELTDEGIDGGLKPNEEPDYGSPSYLQHVRMLAPQEEWQCDIDGFVFSVRSYEGKDLEGIESGRLHILCKAVVLYRDTLNPETIHSTRFCYTYLRAVDDYRPSGPSQYTQYT